MSELKLVLYPDPILTAVAAEIDLASRDWQSVGEEMLTLMNEFNGIGLAGPQAGLSDRIFVLNVTGTPDDARICINPEVVDKDGRETAEEGCLSLPGIVGEITRPEWIEVRYTTPDGELVEMEMEGLLGRAFQHELDHLDGILILNKWTPADQMSNKAALQELEQQFADR
jgi:peptide deformylase